MCAPSRLERNPRDAVVQHPATRLQDLGDPLGVLVDLREAHVLDHADAGNGVEALPA